MTSDIKNICAAYASMYNNDLKTQLQEGRDGFSEMDLSSLTNVQIQDIIEEVIEEMFNGGNGFLDVEVQMEDMFDHARTAFDKSAKRIEKINRVESAFNTVMESISSKSSRTMIETFMKYRQTKKYQESQGHRLGVSLKETNASYGRSVSGSKSATKTKIAEMMRSASDRIASGDSNVAQEVDEATAMAKRGYDEAPIRQKIAKSTGGGEAADRASALEKKSTFGDAKKAKARQELARKQRGDFRKTTSSSPGLHGYAHKSDDAGVKAKQAARGAQRGALTPAEKKQFNREEFDIFDVVLEFLQVEGYAETLEEAQWIMANELDDETIDAILDEALTGERIKKVIRKPSGTDYTRMHSADPKNRPTKRGGWGEKGASKQSDFSASDRGAGNKAARRSGRDVYDSRYDQD